MRIYLGCAVVLICCCTCCVGMGWVGNFRFVLKMPENLPPDAAAPLLCAGITVYSPMRYFGMDLMSNNFGLVGLGGLGHMAVKFAKAFGMKVTVFSTSPHNEKEAREVLGADEFIISKDLDRMKVTTNTPKTKKKVLNNFFAVLL